MDLKLPVILAFVRQILIAGGTALATSGVMDAAQVEVIAGGIVALIAVIWGLVSKNKDTKTIEKLS